MGRILISCLSSLKPLPYHPPVLPPHVRGACLGRLRFRASLRVTAGAFAAEQDYKTIISNLIKTESLH